MIAYLKGTMSSIQEESVIVEVNGIGYELICPNPFNYQSKLQENVLILTYFHVREDAQILYGFENEDQKYLFTKLISVSGIGPKSAISILASVEVSDFIRAIEIEDDKYLTQFPGVGKKTARQIILDLKGKLNQFMTIERSEVEPKKIQNVELKETEEALQALGYSSKEIKTVLPQLKKLDLTDTNQLIKKALALLVRS